MGDSITDFWRNESGPFAGKPVLDKYFGDWKVANFGIAGDTTQGVLYRLQNGEGEGFQPKAVMLMIGTNNTGRNTAAEIAEGIGAVVLELQGRFAKAKILLLAVFPRGGADDPARRTIAEINRTIAKLHDGGRVHYLDIGAKFLDADGNIPREVMSDALHPSAKGYEIWAEAVKGPLTELMKAAAAPKKAREPAPEPVTFTQQEDHRNMLTQLGITKLRPGRNANQDAPNAANYDEAKANPYPKLPEVLTLKSGEKVTTPQQWREQRRGEIVEDFEREVVGRIPKNVPPVKWEVRETRESTVGETPVIEKHVVGVVDNSACPSIEVNISMSLTVPKDAAGPVPVLMMFGRTPFDPPPPGFPAGGRPGGRPGGFGPPGPSRQEQLIGAGWGYALISPGSVQADNGAGLTRGIIGLTNRGQPRKPDDWGALRAWGWGASRGLDYLATDPKVDAKKVGIEGVSRYGKAALVTMAFDTRFAMVLVGSSGEGGASLYRRDFGESVENLTGGGEYHWMAGSFLKYGAEESSFGSKNASDLPVDSHQLFALCSPRLTFISYGVPERGDAHWLDHQGSYMAAVAAGPVFRLLGARDLGTSDDYMTERMPAVNIDMLDGHLAWRQHDGGHTDAPNIPHFIRWADKMLGRPSPAASEEAGKGNTDLH
jgi:lysophospholipase L1-like esterase